MILLSAMCSSKLRATRRRVTRVNKCPVGRQQRPDPRATERNAPDFPKGRTPPVAGPPGEGQVRASPVGPRERDHLPCGGCDAMEDPARACGSVRASATTSPTCAAVSVAGRPVRGRSRRPSTPSVLKRQSPRRTVSPFRRSWRAMAGPRPPWLARPKIVARSTVRAAAVRDWARCGIVSCSSEVRGRRGRAMGHLPCMRPQECHRTWETDHVAITAPSAMLVTVPEIWLRALSSTTLP
jgi:hypothetical protein